MEAAFFDLDKTVIAKASMLAFGIPFYKEGLISRRTVLRTLYAQAVYLHLGASDERLGALRESALAIIKGWKQQRVRQVVRETMDQVVIPIIYKEALELIEHHRKAGRMIVIVSASPEEIVLPLSEHLGADSAIASRPRVDEFGRYTGEMELYAYGAFKAQAMEDLAKSHSIDLAASYAYSDSYTDVPMLESVGHPSVVNPDRVLARLAKERGWETLQFKEKMKMEPEADTPARMATLAALRYGAAGLAGVAIGWRVATHRHNRPGALP